MGELNRRQVLKSAVLFLIIGQASLMSLFQKRVNAALSFDKPDEKHKGRYKVTFKTGFPRPMTHKEHEAKRKDCPNAKATDELTNEFRRSGKIVSEKFKFNSNGTTWVAIFDSKQSYLEYQERKKKIKFEKSRFAGYHFHKIEEYA